MQLIEDMSSCSIGIRIVSIEMAQMAASFLLARLELVPAYGG